MKSHFFQHIFTGLFFSAQYASCLTSQQDLRRRCGDMADQACWSRNLAWTFDCSHKWQRVGSQVLYKGPHCSWTVVHPDESLCMIFLLFSKVFIIWDLLNLPNIKNIFYSLVILLVVPQSENPCTLLEKKIYIYFLQPQIKSAFMIGRMM